MTNSRFESGQVIRYPYLWRRQAEQGQHIGEKDRPACLAIALFDDRQQITHLVILAISSTPPQLGQIALEIPPLEMKRAGLSTFKRGWITVGEYNYDIAEHSYHLEPSQKPRGRFGPRFLEEIRQALRPVLAARAGRVDRTR